MKHFFPFRLDSAEHCLWRGETRVSLRPKAFAVLNYLVERAGHLVSQSELLHALWPDTFVQPEVLKSHILEVRVALGDNSKHPSFIETLPRRGYRFIKTVKEMADPPSMPDASNIQIVGRERELEKLQHYLRQAATGDQHVVFVTGEAGIGKTTLVDAFAQKAREPIPAIRSGRGQCVEGYGVQEPYYPFLVTLGKLLREHEDLLPLLETHAPTWLVQFPGLLKPEHRQTLAREILGATRQRMVREFCDLLQFLTAEETLLLILEDIHWADAATIELIAAIAHRRSPARLLLLATYRSVDAVSSQHALKQVKQNLDIHGLCQEVPLGPLDEGEVAQYLIAQSPGHSLPYGLAGLMHRFCEGNPLFLRAALDHLLASGYLLHGREGWIIEVPLAGIEIQVPESLRQMLELQVERLSRQQQLALEVASVCGVSFPAYVAASAGNLDPERYEDICQKLVQRRQILRTAGLTTLPNGSTTTRHQFVHAFYRRTIYDRLPPQRRSRFHLRVGESLEALYSENPGKIASELALHFEAGCDWKKAAKYLQLAAANKGQRFAYREAAADLERALELLAKLPAGESAAAEMEIMQKLGAIYFALEDSSRSISVLETVAKRAALAHDNLTEIPTLIQMGIVLGRISAARAGNIVQRLLELCDREQNPALRARARMGALLLRFTTGVSKEQDAQEFRSELAKVGPHLDRCTLAAHTTEYALFQFFLSQYQDSISSIEENLPVLVEAGDIRHRAGLLVLILSLTFSGNWSKALRVAQEATATAQKNGNFSREYALRLYQAWPRLFAHDWTGALELCEAALPMLREPYQAAFLHQGLTLAGTAHVGLGNYELASKYLAQARKEIDTTHVVLDWYWKMPLQSALTELSLQQENLVQARVEARRFVEISMAASERTWQALAWEASARVALAGSDLPRGQNCICKALAVMEGFDVPLAFWRVYATAMQLFPEAAEEHRRSAASGILRLTESLRECPSLQETFLSSESVHRVIPHNAISTEMRPPISIPQQYSQSTS